MKRTSFLLSFILFTAVCGVRAQRITQIAPSNLTLRAVSLASLNTAMTVGDSAYVAITHNARLTTDTWTLCQSGFSTSITLDAVAYAGDTLDAVIAGSQGSLAWTSDGGSTWTPVSLGTTATIRALIWNKQGVLIGVGDSGLVIRSTNQGHNWNPVASTTTAQLNAISFGTPNDAVAAGNDTTLIQTHDAGQTWAPMPFPYNFHAVDPSYFDTLIKRIDFSSVLMVGTDSVWVTMTRFVEPLFMYRGTWTPDTSIKGSANPPLYNYTAIVNVGLRGFYNWTFTSSDVYAWDSAGTVSLAAAKNRWYSSTTEFTSTSPGSSDLVPQRILGAACWKEDTAITVCFVGKYRTVWRYEFSKPHDIILGALYTLEMLPPGALPNDFIDVSILPNGYGYATGVLGIQRTTDSGKSWTSISNPVRTSGTQFSFDSTFNNILTLDSTTAFATGWEGMVYKISRTDSGFRAVGLSGGFTVYGIAFPTQDTGIIVGEAETILLTTDGGATWQTVLVPGFTSPDLYDVAFQNSRNGVIVGDNGTILRTTDGGASWMSINTSISGIYPYYTLRHVQAFPDGTFLAAGAQPFGTESILFRSVDTGQNWNAVSLPAAIGDTAGMSFYSPQIGIVAAKMTSSEVVPDTAHLYLTTDGASTWQPFSVPMFSNNRIVFHWLSDHEVMLYGLFSIVDVEFSASGVHVTNMDHSPPIEVYPNPTSEKFRVDYTMKASGPVQIELWDETGKKVATLFRGEEAVGSHDQEFSTPTDLHGNYFIRVSADGATSSTKLTIQ